MFLFVKFDSLALWTVGDVLLDVFGDSRYEVFAFENGDGLGNSPMSLEDAVMVCVNDFGDTGLWNKYAVSEPYALVEGFIFWIKSVVTVCVCGDAMFEIPGIGGVVWEPVVWVNWWCKCL